ncbi:hypothetical protein C6P72_11840 [Burkholderia gladioli]|nr:hypothetical protein C6P72_11840 [Burkholderia gladioli]
MAMGLACEECVELRDYRTFWRWSQPLLGLSGLGFTVVQGIRGGARARCGGGGIGARTWSLDGERACRRAGFPRMASGAAKDSAKTWVT